MRHDQPDTVTASETGEFVFCGESWRLAKTGHVAANQAERDRGAVEALGRKNYSFVGSDRSGHTAAILYSFVGSCKRLGGDPFAYLKDVLGRLPTQPGTALRSSCPTRGSRPI